MDEDGVDEVHQLVEASEDEGPVPKPAPSLEHPSWAECREKEREREGPTHVAAPKMEREREWEGHARGEGGAARSREGWRAQG